MAKQTKSKKSKSEKTDLPELVTVMAKLVERLETLEKKTDLVLSRIGELPQAVRRAGQEVSQPSPSIQVPSQRPAQNSPQQNHGPRERTLYQAVCADCRKNCEVPFKPSGDRPVYCKECFAIRKAGHAPKDPDQRVAALHQQRKLIMPPPIVTPPAPEPAAKGKKAKPAKKKKKK